MIAITMGILAYNEEANIANTVKTVTGALARAKIRDYEILIINDGSKDRTLEIAQQLRSVNKRIRIISDPTNRGIGYATKAIIQHALGKRVCFVAGDDLWTEYAIFALLSQMNKADVVLNFFINKEHRTRFRILLSYMFNILVTFAFNLHVSYLNGCGIYDTKLLRSITLKSNRYFLGTEMNLKLLLGGARFYEVGTYIKPYSVKSNAISLKSLIDIFKCLIRTFWEIKRNRELYGKTPRRVIDT